MAHLDNTTSGHESQFNRPFPPTRGLLYNNIFNTFLSDLNPTNDQQQFSSPFPPTQGNQFNSIFNTVLSTKNPTNTVNWNSVFSNKQDSNQFNITSTERKFRYTDEDYTSYINWSAPDTRKAENSNINVANASNRLLQLGASRLGGFLGFPQVTQGLQKALSSAGTLSARYSTLAFDQLNPPLSISGKGSFVKYSDFRSRRSFNSISDLTETPLADITSRLTNLQANAASSALLGSPISIAYAAASLTPAGAYSVFNLESTYGWGEHDDPSAIRNDFTAKSHINTIWNQTDRKFVKVGINASLVKRTTAALELALPFRGDKVTAIDFQKEQKLGQAYQWNPMNKVLGIDVPNGLGQTKDFIKFYLTGPKLAPGSDTKDEIIVFRSAITNLGDSFSADWSGVQMIGRADQNYHYGGYGRTFSLSFDVYATDRDEMKPIWRKLNALAGYMAPKYDGDTIAMKGPWMRITIGDIFIQTPVVMTSLSYDYSTDAPWEINIENDPEMMQLPMKVSVSCGFNVITNEVPQHGGRFFGLAKDFEDGLAKSNTKNWLSDFKDNVEPIVVNVDNKKEIKEQAKQERKKKKAEKITKQDVNNWLNIIKNLKIGK